MEKSIFQFHTLQFYCKKAIPFGTKYIAPKGIFRNLDDQLALTLVLLVRSTAAIQPVVQISAQ